MTRCQGNWRRSERAAQTRKCLEVKRRREPDRGGKITRPGTSAIGHPAWATRPGDRNRATCRGKTPWTAHARPLSRGCEENGLGGLRSGRMHSISLANPEEATRVSEARPSILSWCSRERGRQRPPRMDAVRRSDRGVVKRRGPHTRTRARAPVTPSWDLTRRECP